MKVDFERGDADDEHYNHITENGKKKPLRSSRNSLISKNIIKVSSKSISENKSKKEKAKDCCCGNVPLLYLCLTPRFLPSHTQ
jgi:hypothetical protein